MNYQVIPSWGRAILLALIIRVGDATTHAYSNIACVAVLPLQLHAGAGFVQCVSADRLPRQVRLHVGRSPCLQRLVLQCLLPRL